MKVCIHRGTREIGGTCIEIESKGKRIVLDIGLPLDATDPLQVPLHPIKGFAAPEPSLLAVCISHPHEDHYGLAHRLPKETTFLIGEAADAILRSSELFSPASAKLQNTVHLQHRKPIALGPFTITPFLMDHSAYDSYALLVKADGKGLFYSGDFRTHGRKSSLVKRLITDPPRDVDVLLMEGTTIGRRQDEQAFATEATLESRIVDLFQQTKGMPLFWCSSQNIDRIVTLFRACKRTDRQLIIDMYTAQVLRATGNDRVPQADWEDIRVFLPSSQKRRIVRARAFDLANRYRPHRIFSESLPEVAPRSVILFRPSMMLDLERAHCLTGACIISSIWPGYLDQEQNRPLLQWIESHSIPLHLNALRGAPEEG